MKEKGEVNGVSKRDKRKWVRSMGYQEEVRKQIKEGVEVYGLSERDKERG